MFDRKLFSLFLSALFLTGCGGVKSMLTRKVPPPKPEIFVFPFDCECTEVSLSSSVTTGFMTGLPSTIQPLDLQGFESHLTSMSVTLGEVMGVVPIRTPDAAAPPPSASDSPGLSDPLSPGQEFTAHQDSPPPAATPAAPAEPPPPAFEPSAQSYSKLVSDLFTKRAARERFYKTTGIEYVLIGRGKQKVLSALEAGNLITLQTADVKLLDVQSGEVIVDDSFKQGIFEIVAADRIGKKLAGKVMAKFKEIEKDAKRQRKLDKQREKRRKAFTD